MGCGCRRATIGTPLSSKEGKKANSLAAGRQRRWLHDCSRVIQGDPSLAERTADNRTEVPVERKKLNGPSRKARYDPACREKLRRGDAVFTGCNDWSVPGIADRVIAHQVRHRPEPSEFGCGVGELSDFSFMRLELFGPR